LKILSYDLFTAKITNIVPEKFFDVLGVRD
jgi:hypothetical protein